MSILPHITPVLFRKVVVTTILEFGPLVLFLIAYDFFHIYKATFILMGATILSTVIMYHREKRLPYAGLYVAFLTICFGYLTLTHQNPGFIQLRDTVYDVINALVLLVGLLFNVLFLKIAFNNVIPMTTHSWRRLTYAWVLFFILAALVNEYIRQFQPFDIWITYKTAMIFITTIFGFGALFLFYEKDSR